MRRSLDVHPHLGLALKGALAALTAWLVVQPLEGFLDDYQYYAPLGAVVSLSPALSRAARSAVQAVVAIAAGGLLAFGVQLLPLPQPIAVAVAVGVGVACSFSRRLGSMGSWVPFVALFALVLHEIHPWRYVIAYILLAGVGALIGLLVDFALPQFPTGPVSRAERRLSGELAQALEVLADAISRSEPLGSQRQDALRAGLEEKAQDLRQAVNQMNAASRGNWRTKGVATPGEAIEHRTRSLQRLTIGIAHVLDVADRTAPPSAGGDAPFTAGLPAGSRDGWVNALRRAAQSLRDWSQGSSSPWSAQDRAELLRLREELTEEGVHPGQEPRLALLGLAAELGEIALETAPS